MCNLYLSAPSKSVIYGVLCMQVVASAVAALAASSVALNSINNAYAFTASEAAASLYTTAATYLGSSSVACPDSVRPSVQCLCQAACACACP